MMVIAAGLRFIMSTSAAISVRLPLDRGPAISTSPSCSPAERLHLRRQPELLDRHRPHRHEPEHAAWTAVIPEAHAADTADAVDVADPLGRPAGTERFAAAFGHQRLQQRLDVAFGVRTGSPSSSCNSPSTPD